MDDSSPSTDFALDSDRIRERIAALKDGGDFETIEGQFHRHLLMADALSGVAAALIRETAIEEISDMVLACAKALTESSAGYAGYIDAKTGYLVCPTMTRDVWQICEVPEKDIVFRRFGGLWGWVLKNRKPLMTNDPAADDRAGGVPDGHIPIERFLSVPALYKDRLVGQIALANANRDYGQEDLAFVTRLAELYSLAVHRIEQEQALKETKDRLEQRIKERTAALTAVNRRLKREIAERNSTEAALVNSERRFRQLYEKTPAMLHSIDAEGRLVAVSDHWLDVMGYGRNEVIGRKSTEFLTAESRRIAETEALPAFFKTGEVWDFPYRFKKKSGEEIDVRMSAISEKDEQGRVKRSLAVIVDVTDQLRAEAGLRKSERFSRSILDALSAHVAVLDADGRVVSVNRAWEVFAEDNGGDPAAVSVGADYFDVCRRAIQGAGDEAAQRAMAGIEDVLQGRRPSFQMEYPCDSPAMNRRFQMHATPLAGDDGGAVIAHTDITEASRIAAALMESEERLRSLVESSSDHIFIIGTDGVYLDSNGRVDHVGLSDREQIVGKPLEQVYPPEVAAAYRSYLNRVVSTGETVEFEHDMPESGSARHHLDTLYPIYKNGAVAAVGGICRDITPKKDVEEALRVSERRYREFFENAPFGIFHATLAGRFLFVNPALARMLGYDTADEALASISDISSQVYVEPGRRQQVLDRLLAGTGLKVHESRFYRRNGEEWVARVFLQRIDGGPEGEPYLEGFVEDITERRKAQALLTASREDLRRLSNRLISAQEDERRRIAIELHDQLGQDLMTLKLNLRPLQRQLEPWQAVLKDRCEALLSQIEEVGQNVRRLSKELSPSILEDLGLSVAIQWLAQEIGRHFGLKIDTRLEEFQDLVEAEKEILVYRIVQEALTNVGRHAAADRASVWAGKSGQAAVIVVEDNGCGFDMDALRTGDARHRGLGLTAMDERARMLGARLQVESRPGRGTRITLTLSEEAGK